MKFNFLDITFSPPPLPLFRSLIPSRLATDFHVTVVVSKTALDISFPSCIIYPRTIYAAEYTFQLNLHRADPFYT